MKAGPERELLRRYIDRAEGSARGVGLAGVDIVEVAESPARASPQRKREEAAALRAKIPDGSTVISLDEGGESLDSDAFAALLSRSRDSGIPGLVLVIGGPDGLDAAWRKDHRSIAFGRMTIPHQLVRVLLAEQIYRAITIMAGHPYHRA